jgi:undecaprenyl diphosphate synthase
MKNYQNLITPDSVPGHIAIIMDGNGRWAKMRSLPRSEGHKKGAEVIEPLVDAAVDIGIKAISLYAFSVENWLRPKLEVVKLWSLLEYFFQHNIRKIKDKNIRIKHTGSLKKLPPSTKKTIRNAVEETSGNKRMVLNFCINYGSRQEIVEAVNDWLDKRKKSEKLTVKKLEKCLFTNDLPEIDLMIRTSGEYRISNFLLWQLAYAELYFTDVLWPDFTPEHLYKAVYDYQNRERRFGGI